jgi:predicted Zn-dependent peptidase
MKRVPALLLAALSLSTSAALAARLPTPISRTLPNGLRVVVFQRPGLPIVQAQLSVPAGLTAEAPGHGGLAFLTAQLLRQGTTSRSAGDFATELDTLGATLAINVTRDAGQLAAGCRVQEFDGLLELMSDAVVNPLFSDDAFQSVRRQIAGQLGQQSQNPASLADERAAGLAFGTHPYGRSMRGNLEALLGTTRDQVREFHRDHWRPDHAVLAIAGDIDAERAFSAAAEWFGRWGGKAAAELPNAPPVPRKGTFLYDLPGSPSTEVRAALAGPGRGDPAYAGWAVAREALEGGLLPIGIHSTLVPGRDASLLLVSASARPESTAVVAARVRAVLSTLGSAPPAGGVLDAARRRTAQAWPLSLETLGQVLASWLAGDAAGLPAGHLDSMPAAFLAADCAGVARAIQSGYALLLEGPAERMKGRLAPLGEIQTLGPEGEPGVADAGANATPEQRRRGKQLIAQAVAAHGGAAKLAAARVSEMHGDLKLTVAGRELTGEVRTLRVDPDRLAYTTRLLEFEHRQVLDGARGWALSMVGDSAALVPSDTTALASLRGLFESDVVHLLRAASTPTADPIAQDKGELDGKPCDRVEFVAPRNGRTRLSLDATTHRVVAVEDLPTPQGVWRDRRLWSEYLLVEGVWWPQQELREVDGEQATHTILRKLTVNGPVDSTLFRRPIVARGEIRGLE